MIQTTAKYKEILKNPRHWKETKLNISGVDYMEADIISASIPKTEIFSTFDIGNCVSRELDIEILPKGTIPRQAKIQAFVRLVLDSDCSEWIPQGTFFIKHREKDKATGALSITAFDSMLKTDEVWLNEQYDLENWPMPQNDAVSDIAEYEECRKHMIETIKNTREKYIKQIKNMLPEWVANDYNG